MMGAWMVIAVEIIAGFLGYMIGEARGRAKEANKRRFN